MEGTAQPYRLVVPLPRYSIGLALALVAAGFVLSFVYFPWPKAVALAVAFVAVGIRWHRSCSATKALWLWPGHHLAFAADDAPRRGQARKITQGPKRQASVRWRGGRGATYLIELPSLSESDRWALAHWCATGRPPRS